MKKAFEDFIKTWNSEIAKIEKRPIDSHGAYLIYLDFRMNKRHLGFAMTDEERKESYQELNNLESRVKIALQTARCLFILQNRSIWARIAESIATMIYNKLLNRS